MSNQQSFGDQDRIKPLISAQDEPSAAMIVAALRDRGIDAVAEGGLTAGFRAETFGEVKVMVRENDLKRARAALDDYLDAVKDIDWDDVDVGEPEAE